MRIRLCASLCTLALAAACGCSSDAAAQIHVGNPYEGVDWQTFSHHRADLHIHTIQSDGCHLPDEVVRAFNDAGFSVLSITDHDGVSPNGCPTRDAATTAQIDFGIFADYGVPGSDDAPPMNEQLHEVARRRGLASLNHPFRVNESLEWYLTFYREHSAEYLVGLELAADRAVDVDYSVGLWDQLLGHLMPSRPIWGFGTSDTHLLVRTRFAFTVFLLDELTTESVKEAMRSGRFYSVIGPRFVNLSRDRGPGYGGQTTYDGTYPELRSIAVDRDAGEISIDAAGYDEIVWISQRASSEPRSDDVGPWPPGEVVQRGPVFNYSDSDAPYVRAELLRYTDDGPIRLFINPFALIHQ
jgi:hypothetical protein